MISLTEIANDPDFAQGYLVVRSSGIFALGTYQVTSRAEIPFWGIIQPATDEDLTMVAEADRITGSIGFISEQQMFATRQNGIGHPSGLSDQIQWNNAMYKVGAVVPWKDFGFWKAIGIRMGSL